MTSSSSLLKNAEFSRKLEDSIKTSSQNKPVFTLTTLGLDGAPRGRIMVLPDTLHRHLLDDGVLTIGTNKDSSKWAELERDPRFEACIYFPHSQEQYRLRGNQVKFEGLEKDVWDQTPQDIKQEYEKSDKGKFGVLQLVPNVEIAHCDHKMHKKTVCSGESKVA